MQRFVHSPVVLYVVPSINSLCLPDSRTGNTQDSARGKGGKAILAFRNPRRLGKRAALMDVQTRFLKSLFHRYRHSISLHTGTIQLHAPKIKFGPPRCSDLFSPTAATILIARVTNVYNAGIILVHANNPPLQRSSAQCR